MGSSVPKESSSASVHPPLRRVAPVMSSGKPSRKLPSRMRMSPMQASGVEVVDAATGLAAGVRHTEKNFAVVGELGAVVPGLRRIDFGMMAAGAVGARHLVHKLVRRIEIENALAGIANDDLLAGTNFVVSLGPQHDLARHAFVIANLGDACCRGISMTRS